MTSNIFKICACCAKKEDFWLKDFWQKEDFWLKTIHTKK